ncbi:MAG: SGNH/GDSL hydrolase family protein [Sphingobacteriales bacterium]
MRLLCSIILTIATLSGCAKKQADTTSVTMTKKDTIATVADDSLQHYLALGDSYTIGEAEPYNLSFPYQLWQALKQENYKLASPTIIATTGWTTDNLINAIAQNTDVKGKTYDMVTLLIGVNDQFQGLSQDSYKIKFQQVLNTAIQFAGGNKTHVFVLSIPDYGVTPFARGDDARIGPLIDQFNAINKSISLAARVNYLDITGISRQAATDSTLIAPDGLHPSGKMYMLWVQQLVPLVEAKVKSN